MQYYNLLIYFQSASLSGGGDKLASPYMAVQKPLLVTILNLVTLKVLNQPITSEENIKMNNYNIQIDIYKVTKVTKKSNQSYSILTDVIFLLTRAYFGMNFVV